MEILTKKVILESNDRVSDILLEGENLYIVTNNTDGRGNPGEGSDRLIQLTYNLA